jgi:hypothetical protein
VACGRSPATRWFVADSSDARTRHIVFRGVVWRGDEGVDRTALAARLAAAWPTALARGVPLSAHSGVAALADALWADIAPHVVSRPPGSRLALAGHSLGGALALLCLVHCRLRLGVPPAAFLPVHAFGSPPVLVLDRARAPPAARDAPPGAGALQLLQLRAGAVRQFVLDTDPVPRLWHAADPLLAAARAAPAAVRPLGAAALAAAAARLPAWARFGFAADAEAAADVAAVAGADADAAAITSSSAPDTPPAPVSDDTAAGGLYDTTGAVYWLRWDGLRPRCEVLPPSGVAAALALPPESLLSPSSLLRASLDHNRRAYAAAMEALAADEGADGDDEAAARREA